MLCPSAALPPLLACLLGLTACMAAVMTMSLSCCPASVVRCLCDWRRVDCKEVRAREQHCRPLAASRKRGHWSGASSAHTRRPHAPPRCDPSKKVLAPTSSSSSSSSEPSALLSSSAWPSSDASDRLLMSGEMLQQTLFPVRPRLLLLATVRDAISSSQPDPDTDPARPMSAVCSKTTGRRRGSEGTCGTRAGQSQGVTREAAVCTRTIRPSHALVAIERRPGPRLLHRLRRATLLHRRQDRVRSFALCSRTGMFRLKIMKRT